MSDYECEYVVDIFMKRHQLIELYSHAEPSSQHGHQHISVGKPCYGGEGGNPLFLSSFHARPKNM